MYAHFLVHIIMSIITGQLRIPVALAIAVPSEVMKLFHPLLLCLLWALLEVHSQQTFPYISFMGEALPYHAYVNLSLVGEDDSDPGNIVRCHTDLVKCCSFHQDRIYGTDHRGNWFAPGRDSRLPLPFEGGGI